MSNNTELKVCRPAAVPGDKLSPYPRVCSHRGFNTVAPENSMAAFGAAAALGADELEMDIWPSKDGRLVVCHNRDVDHMSDGTGMISDLNWNEIEKFNIGRKFSPRFDGLRFPLLEHVLQKFGRQVIINLHIKSGEQSDEYDHDVFRSITGLIYEYDCADHVYIAGISDVMRTAIRMAPELRRCILDGKKDFKLVGLAREFGCKKLQFARDWAVKEHPDCFNQKMIDDARAAGIRCNLFWSDDPAQAVEYIKRGIDTILTNDFFPVAEAVRKYRDKYCLNL